MYQTFRESYLLFLFKQNDIYNFLVYYFIFVINFYYWSNGFHFGYSTLLTLLLELALKFVCILLYAPASCVPITSPSGANGNYVFMLFNKLSRYAMYFSNSRSVRSAAVRPLLHRWPLPRPRPRPRPRNPLFSLSPCQDEVNGENVDELDV